MSSVRPGSFLNIQLTVTGSPHTGKTLVAARFIKLMRRIGFPDIKHIGHELFPEDMEALIVEEESLQQPPLEQYSVTIVEHHTHRIQPDVQQQMVQLKTPSDINNVRSLFAHEHPIYKKRMWADEAVAETTIYGYWEWVANKIAAA